MLVDNVVIRVIAGNGGDGAATFERNARTAKGGPSGGNGGNGGSIFFLGSNNVSDLREFRYQKKVQAENGIPGKKFKLYGKNATDLTVLVPLGTQITDVDAGKVYEIADTVTPVLVAQGGRGGRGNVEFKSATRQTPTYAEKGRTGEKKRLLLELKIIADIGLIGLPNAGKSSLLAVLTNAKPLIGDYPFTTLEPNIGVFGSHVIADIPGLIEGAAQGKGLGTKFLRHIEKTKLLVHLIDIQNEDPEKVYQIVREELKQHNPALLEKGEIILLNKTDLVATEVVKKYTQKFKKKGLQVLSGSIYDPASIAEIKQVLNKWK